MAETCGCPPTDEGIATGVHHVIVNVKDLARSREFYGRLLPDLGYPGCTDAGSAVGWYGQAGSFWIKQADARFAADAFHKDRVGLCEIAFAATSLGQVNALARKLERARKLLEQLKLVDGPGSGLDADLLRGNAPDAFAGASHTHANLAPLDHTHPALEDRTRCMRVVNDVVIFDGCG